MARKICFLVVVSKKVKADTRFEGGTHENCTERNKMSFGI